MACDFINKGRLLPCKEFLGGLLKVWFMEFTGSTKVDIDNNALDDSYLALTGFTGDVPTIYEYELKGTSRLNQEMISSRENGGTYVTQTLTLDLQGGDLVTNNQIKLLAYGRPHIFVQDNYGSVWYCGKIRGMDLTSGVHDTGAAYADKYGYTLTFVGTENSYADYAWGSEIGAPFGGLDEEPTIVVGT